MTDLDTVSQNKSFSEHIKSLGWLWRHGTQFLAIMSIIYFGAGSVVEPHAQEVFQKLLEKNDSFKVMKEQTEGNGKKLETLKSEIDALQSQVGTVAAQISAQNAAASRMEKDIDKLVDVLINRRTSIDDIPPWPTEVRP